MSQHYIHIPALKSGATASLVALLLPVVVCALILFVASLRYPNPTGWLCPGFEGVVVKRSDGIKHRGTPRLDGTKVSPEAYRACVFVELPHNGAGE